MKRAGMRKQSFLGLVRPFAALLARQLANPRGWFGRVVMLRALNRGNRQLIAATLGQLELAPETRLLDVGFGGGLSFELAARRGVRSLTGVDPSEEAVRVWQGRRARRLGASAPRVLRGCVEALPFGSDAFDAVISTNTIYFWQDLDLAFRELLRVLAAGGQLALGFSSTQKLRTFAYVTRHGFTFHTSGELQGAAERAGFERIRLVELHGGDVEGDALLLAAAPLRGSVIARLAGAPLTR